jgi:hypothetical protein
VLDKVAVADLAATRTADAAGIVTRSASKKGVSSTTGLNTFPPEGAGEDKFDISGRTRLRSSSCRPGASCDLGDITISHGGSTGPSRGITSVSGTAET